MFSAMDASAKSGCRHGDMSPRPDTGISHNRENKISVYIFLTKFFNIYLRWGSSETNISIILRASIVENFLCPRQACAASVNLVGQTPSGGRRDCPCRSLTPHHKTKHSETFLEVFQHGQTTWLSFWEKNSLKRRTDSDSFFRFLYAITISTGGVELPGMLKPSFWSVAASQHTDPWKRKFIE